MKKLFFLALLLLYQVGFSQQITLAQYWFGDNFVGRDEAVVTANANNEIIFDIEFPDNGTNELNEYFHCRFRDSDGNWSAIYSQQMSNNNDASTSQVKVQYWFDGNSPIGRPEVTINNILVNGELDHQELEIPWPAGAKEIHYRFKSSYNKWSSIQSSDLETTVYQNNQITKVEYWFGDGFANRGEPVAVTANANNEIILNILYPDDGINQLDTMVHYRFLDGIGNWSCIYSEQMVAQNTSVASEVKVQYWFDDNFNPNNTLQLLTNDANGNQINSIPIVWEADAQTIHYRFKSKYNQWTSIQSTNIDEIENRDNKIVELEWWLNNGFAAKAAIPVNQTGDAFLDIRNLTLIPNIQNTIHVRYKDKMNRWSSVFSFFPKEPGITVLVHGFQAGGGTVNYESDFYKMGVDILNRNGGGIIYKNNKDTGTLEFMPGTYILNPASEIILVYDWMDLSDNGVLSSTYEGNGYLESASDNLLATILSLSNTVGLTKEQILKKPKHFIAHSRGTILTLQFLHRLATYFPETKVEQFTLLDPHPATTFGDLQSEQEFSPANLPCVYGVATDCTSTVGCGTVGNDVYLKIPNNVLKADNYFRKDTQGYEGVGNLGQFDGLSVFGLGAFDRELNNTVLVNGSPYFTIPPGIPTLVPNSHSGVHKWYRGTINFDINVAEPTLFNTPFQNTTSWYINGSTNTLNDFLQTENRFTTGFNRTRIGKGDPVTDIDDNLKISLTEMNISLRDRYGLSASEYPNGVSPHTVFGGYFDTNNNAGWSKNGGESEGVPINNGKAQILQYSQLKHSLMYFEPNYNFLKMNIYESTSTSDTAYSSLKVTFYDYANNPIGSPYIRVLNPSIFEVFIPLPNDLKGQIGTFKIENDIENAVGSFFKVDEIKLVVFGPNGSCGDTTTWTGTAWTNGVPNTNMGVIIAGNYDLVGDLTACSLTVSGDAIVLVPAGSDFTISGPVSVAVGSSLTFENNANLIQTGSTTTLQNSGVITSIRNTSMRRLDYTFWSSPVVGQNLKAFSPQTVSPPVGSSRFYELSENPTAFVAVDPLMTSFGLAKGYSVRAPNNFPTNASLALFTGLFTGTPRTGDISIAATNTATTGTGFNLIGNPYPSPISAAALIAANPGTLYFWTHYLQGANSSNYASFNATGATASLSGGIMPNGTIQTGQGFLVHVAANTAIQFNNLMRVGNNDGQFFRTANTDRSRIWLNLNTATQSLNQILVGYLPGATQGFDAAIDGKLNANGSTISTVMNNENYVIQGRALPFATTDVVPMGFKALTDDTYTISIDHVDGLFDTQNIYLKDNVTGAIHDLKISSYSFAATTGTDNTRFEIVYDNLLATQTPKFDTNSVVIFKQNNVLNINAGKVTMKAVKVFDIRGRLVFEQSNINATTTSLTNLKAEQQVLLVQITADDNSVVTKKVVY